MLIVIAIFSLQIKAGQQPTIEALHRVTEAPLPILTPKGQSQSQMSQQSVAQSSNRPPAPARKVAEEEDDFTPFQEAPGISPRSNVPSCQFQSEWLKN